MIGEEELFTGERRMYNATVESESIIYEIENERMINVCNENFHVRDILTQKIEEKHSMIQEIKRNKMETNPLVKDFSLKISQKFNSSSKKELFDSGVFVNLRQVESNIKKLITERVASDITIPQTQRPKNKEKEKTRVPVRLAYNETQSNFIKEKANTEENTAEVKTNFASEEQLRKFCNKITRTKFTKSFTNRKYDQQNKKVESIGMVSESLKEKLRLRVEANKSVSKQKALTQRPVSQEKGPISNTKLTFSNKELLMRHIQRGSNLRLMYNNQGAPLAMDSSKAMSNSRYRISFKKSFEHSERRVHSLSAFESPRRAEVAVDTNTHTHTYNL